MSPKTLAPTTETLATQLGYISDVLKANAQCRARRAGP